MSATPKGKKEKKEKKDKADKKEKKDKADKKEKKDKKKEKKEKSSAKEGKPGASVFEGPPKPQKPGVEEVNGEIIISMEELDDMYLNGRNFPVKRYEYPAHIANPPAPVDLVDEVMQEVEATRTSEEAECSQLEQLSTVSKEELSAALEVLQRMQFGKETCRAMAGDPADFQVAVGCFIRAECPPGTAPQPVCIAGLVAGASYVVDAARRLETDKRVRGKNARGETVLVPLVHVHTKAFTEEEVALFVRTVRSVNGDLPTAELAAEKRAELRRHLERKQQLKRKRAEEELAASKVRAVASKPATSDEVVAGLAGATLAVICGQPWRHVSPDILREAVELCKQDLGTELQGAHSALEQARSAKAALRADLTAAESRIRDLTAGTADFAAREQDEEDKTDKKIADLGKMREVYAGRVEALEARLPGIVDGQEQEIRQRKADVVSLQKRFADVQADLDAAEDKVVELKKVRDEGAQQMEAAEEQMFQVHAQVAEQYSVQEKLTKRLARMQVSQFHLEEMLQQARVEEA
ncbi:hypothetical protein DIPPA_00683 [Diplonema papillatum]|nr:hypothetical protein DIPPA_00683 [Diplonema papillatum]